MARDRWGASVVGNPAVPGADGGTLRTRGGPNLVDFTHTQGLHRMQACGPTGRQNTGDDRDQHRAGDDPSHGQRIDQRRNLLKVIDRRIENLATGDDAEQLSDLVDVDDEQEPQCHSHPGADDAQGQAVGQKDAHDAGARGAERFEDADVASFFHDDHEKDRQDAESGHGDDHEQQDVEDRGFHLHGGQQRTLFVAPGLHAVKLGRKACPQSAANFVAVGARLRRI